MNKKETTALFLTDLHIGSRWGLWRPNFQKNSGPHRASSDNYNAVQLRLWDYWLDLCKHLRKLRPDAIFLLGHVIEGLPRRAQMDGSLSDELNLQLSCALSILRMIPRKRQTRVIGLLASGHNDPLYLKMNESLCNELGGKLCGKTGIFTLAGHSFRVYHGSTTAYIYLELVMGRRRTFAQEAIARKKLPEIEGIICGHSHRWLHMRTMWRDGKDFHVVLVPGWESQTDFMLMKDPDKLIPEIGAVIGRFSRDLVEFQCVRYPTPLGISQSVVV